MTDKIVVLNTCGSGDEAGAVARDLVESRVAACVNIVPQIRSVYRWKDVVEDATEWLLIIKSRRELLPAIQARLRKIHSYEVPESVALTVVDGLPEYLDWIDTETTPRTED